MVDTLCLTNQLVTLKPNIPMKTIKLPNSTLVLTDDKRIKHKAIRIARTLYPYLGGMYADRRSYGMRYKSGRNSFTSPSYELLEKMAFELNKIYRINRVNAIAYVHEPTHGWQSKSICIEVQL